MNCNLSDQERKNGARCRSWDCVQCKDFLTFNDRAIIDNEMIKMLRKEVEGLNSKLKAQELELEKARELIEEILGIDNKNKPVVEALKDVRGWEVKAKEFLKTKEGE